MSDTRLSPISVSAAPPQDDARELLQDTPPGVADVRHWAHPQRYSRAVLSLRRIALRERQSRGGFDLVETMHSGLAPHFMLSRLAAGLGFRPGTIAFLKPAEIVAGLRTPATAAAAETALAAAGLVETAHGFAPVLQCDATSPGQWPARGPARAALLLYLILAAVRGDLRSDELHLVRP